jgi:hypothetical protein
MLARLDNLSVFQHMNAVRMSDRGQPVRDNQAGTSDHYPF